MPIWGNGGENSSGAPLASGKLYSYAAGTSTPLATYTDQGLGTANANPTILDSAGRAPIWVEDGVAYKVVLKDSADVTIWTADNVSVPEIAAAPAASNVPVGALLPYGGASAPSGGWLLCNGDAVSRSTYADLFAIIGTTFGVGNGSTTFNVPDMRQRFPLGVAASGTGATLGGTGGTIDHVHTGPAHTHNVGTLAVPSGGAHTHTTDAPSAVVDVQTGSGEDAASPTHTHTVASSGAHVHTVTGATGSEGTGNTGTANPPFTAVSYIIKT